MAGGAVLHYTRAGASIIYPEYLAHSEHHPMNILVVDDNAAIREIFKDILTSKGHAVMTASTLDEAIDRLESKPDIVFLDTKVGSDEGIHLITRHKEVYPDAELYVVLVKGASEQVPTDMPEIVTSIDKPFKSEQVLAAVDMAIAVADERRMNDSGKKRKPKKNAQLKKSSGFFSKKREPIVKVSKAGAAEGADFGTKYVVFEEIPEDIYLLAAKFNPQFFSVAIVSSNKQKAFRDYFDIDGQTIITLSANPKAGSMSIRGLGTLMETLLQFAEEKDRPVIIIDNFKDLVEANGMNSTLVFINQLITGLKKEATVALSVDLGRVNAKERNILLSKMKEYRE